MTPLLALHGVDETPVELVGVALVGGLPVPGQRGRMIGWDAVVAGEQDSQVELGRGEALAGRRTPTH